MQKQPAAIKRFGRFCFGAALLAAVTSLAAGLTPLHKLPAASIGQRLEADARLVELHRQGLRSVIAYMDSRPDLFPVQAPKDSRLLRREEKDAVWGVWQRFLDYLLALDSAERFHADFYHLKGAAKEDSFLIGYSAMLARYRAALEFIDRAENNPELHKILNDEVPELGLPARTYAKLKIQFLNVAIATQFAAREVVMKSLSGERQPALRTAIREDADYIWKTGKGRGQMLTAKNALKIVQDGAQTGWLPIQQGVSEWMGHTKVYRQNNSLISESQIRQLQPKLLPGDILLERREWYLSNIGLPGFWSHAALYIGTPEERRAAFNDSATQAWVRQQGEASGELEALLRSRDPEAYKRMLADRSSTGTTPPIRIIEAIGEGVSFKSLEHSAACDSLVVLRPRLPKSEKSQAILRAFHYSGRPYDFNFDFSTDAELVCTELVYKAYEPAAGCTGLKFPLVEMLGRKVTPANELVKQFDEQYETPNQQFDVVIFLDGRERQKQASEATVAELRRSWKRPKWHVFLQE
jgi:hypothetical protein